MKLVGAQAAKAVGVEPLASKSNYFIGNDPTKWRRNVPSYAKVKYENVYPGIDLIYYGKESGGRSQKSEERRGALSADRAELEFDFVVEPGADPGAIAFEIVGAGLVPAQGGQPQGLPLRVDERGDLVIMTEAGEVRFRKPVVYQPVAAMSSSPTPAAGTPPLQWLAVSSRQSAVNNSQLTTHYPQPGNRQSTTGNRQYIEARYVLRAVDEETGNWKLETRTSSIDNRQSSIDNTETPSTRYEVAFELAAYDKSRPLVIDPVLSYSTYLGGSGTDQGRDIAVDSNGNAYIVGDTDSVNFPTANPIDEPLAAQRSVFVTKMSADGNSLVYSTYLQGIADTNPEEQNEGHAIAVDSSGNAYITGWTTAIDFPTVNPFQANLAAPGQDAFVTKLNSTGDALLYSSYLGGTINELGTGIALDSSGNAYVTGITASSDFPTKDPLQVATAGEPDFFITKVSADGSAMVYSTYLGGTSSEESPAIAVDSSGRAYITGTTTSLDFPTANALQLVHGGGTADAVVARLNAAGSALEYSTFLGGSGIDSGHGIAVDSSGDAYLTGRTISTNFPTASPFQGTNGGADAFITKLSEAGDELLYSTYLGGSGSESGWDIAVDGLGNAYVIGFTASSDFPTATPLQAALAGTSDAFVAQLNAAGNALVYSTYLGGSAIEGILPSGIAVDAFGNAYVTGQTTSTDFPTASFQNSLGGGTDAFVAKITPTLIGPSPYLSQADSPFFASIQAGTTYLETFEDGLLNTPGVTASTGSPIGPSGITDSVDFDDGVIDGFGTGGNSFFSGNGPGGITFTFNPTDLGGFPTHAGIAWTDGGGTTTFEAFDNVGASLGVTGPVAIADGSNSGTTAEDRFFGAVNANGISKIHISNSSGGIEVDHLQYGPFAGANSIVLSTTVADFGTVNVGDSPGMAVTVSNLGGSAVSFTGTITASGSFAVVPGVDCLDLTQLGAGSNCDINLIFSPTIPGPHSGLLFIPMSDPGAPHVVRLAGSAVGAGAPEPVAFIHQPLVPTSVAPGSGGFTLTVRGAGFTPNSIVHWNGNPRTTTFISSKELSALIGSEDLAMATTAEVAVDNPAPGGSGSIRSNIALFHVANPTFGVTYNRLDLATGASPESLALGDFDNDGDIDVATGDGNGNTISIFLGNGNGTFAAPTTLAVVDPRGLTAADFNNDGNADLAIPHGLSPGNVAIALGNGSGSFQTPLDYATGQGPLNAVPADFNADGILDLAVANFSGPVSILLGNGDGTFQPKLDASVTGIYVAAGDFNADGKLDLAAATGGGNSVSVALGNGDGTFQTATPFPTDDFPRSIVAADLDDDGDLDLATANVLAPNTLSVLLGNGNGTFQTSVEYSTGASPTNIIAGDFNADNIIDLATANFNEGVSVLLGTGAGFFGTRNEFVAGSGAFALAAHDFDDDGRLDIAVTNANGNTLSILLQAALGPAVQLLTTSLAFGDQLIDTTSDAMQVTLTNNGTETLNFTSFNVQVTSTDPTASPHFLANNTCGPSLAALASCTINAFFTPMALGPLTAVIAINSDASTSPDFISLSGNGTAFTEITFSTPSVNFTGNPLNLPCPTKPVTITNTGDVPLDIVTIAATAPFSVTHNCPATLAVDASCVADVKFSPTVVGPANGTLTVTTNPATTGNTVALSGNGTPSCQLLARVRSVTVLRGTDVQDFAIEDAKPSCSPVELNLTCSVDNPAACLLNPAIIPPSGASTLKVSNLKRVGGDSLQVDVTSTSEFRTATERVTVRFADFAITRSPESATVEAGGAASYSLAIRPVNGLAGNVAFTCSGAPIRSGCAVEPANITLDGASLAQVKVRVTTASRSGAAPIGGIDLAPLGRLRGLPLLATLLVLILVLATRWVARRAPGGTAILAVVHGRDARATGAMRGRGPSTVAHPSTLARGPERSRTGGGERKSNRSASPLRWAILSATLLAMLLWASCGGGGSMNFGSGGTPAGSFTLTITGTYSSSSGPTPGTLSNSTTVALRVN